MKKITPPNLLNAIYCHVYGTEFHAESINDRVMMQKVVFIMRERGVSCGDYEFVWDQYGPFSAELSDDMKKPIDPSIPSIEFNEDAMGIMECLKKAFSYETTYSVRHWAETIASLLYLKRYKYPSYTDDEIIQELEKRKSDLNNHAENIKAMNVLKTILAA